MCYFIQIVNLRAIDFEDEKWIELAQVHGPWGFAISGVEPPVPTCRERARSSSVVKALCYKPEGRGF
jgi:hypothetical protein